jgi:uncharacterized membrane protein YidH (DUF202 family)
MKYRNIVFVFIMSIVTLGIYDIYWAFSTRDELVKKRQDVPSPWIVLLPLLGLLVVAALEMFVHFVISGSPYEPSSPLETSVNIISVLVGIVSILGTIPLSIYWLWKYCQAAEKVTKGELTTGFNFALALLLSIFGVGMLWPPIVQYQYNKMPRHKVK